MWLCFLVTGLKIYVEFWCCTYIVFDVFILLGPPAQVKPSSPPASHLAPQLLEPIRDQQANEGESIQFRCKIVGTPEPVVQWHYNNQMIKPSKYFQMASENGHHTLTIAGVFPEDQGSYKCTARNPVGEVTCIGHLRVIRKHLS